MGLHETDAIVALMTELALFLTACVEKYSGPGRTVCWKVIQPEEFQVHWLSITDHPNPTKGLDLTFFLRFKWVDVMPSTRGLFGDEAPEGGSLILMDGSVDWHGEVSRVIETWLEDPSSSNPSAWVQD